MSEQKKQSKEPKVAGQEAVFDAMTGCTVIGFGNIGSNPYRVRLWFAMIKTILKHRRPFTWPKISCDGYQNGTQRWRIKCHIILKSPDVKSSSI